MHTSLISHLLTMGQKTSTLGFIRPRSSPKYVNGKLPAEEPKVSSKMIELILGNFNWQHHRFLEIHFQACGGRGVKESF